MDLTGWLALLAIVISVISFLVSFRLNSRSAKADIRPVLAFVFNDTSGWHLSNIGSGPGMNVTVAPKDLEKGEWYNPVRIPPLGEGSSFPVAWLGFLAKSGLGVTYEDFQGRTYSSVCVADLSRVYSGRGEIPKWDEEKIGRHWWPRERLEGGRPS